MRNLLLTLASSFALAGFAAPASADPYDDPHEDKHEQLNERHADTHDDLGEEHADAHEQGVNRWEHRQLHRYLGDKHQWRDSRLRRNHGGWHNRNDWDSYGGYGGYDGYGRSNRYNRNYGRSNGVYFNFGL